MREMHNIGFQQALSTVLGLKPLAPVMVPVSEVCDLVASEDLSAVADCPSMTSSLRDGYAVVSRDLEGASKENPVRLMLAGISVAGDQTKQHVGPGLAVKVMTGAPLPDGADSVIPVEFTRREKDRLVCLREVLPGQNLLLRGTDVERGGCVVTGGQTITPPLAGLLTAAGVHSIPVFPRPRIAIVSTGDEVVTPGRPLRPGQVYASNLVTLQSWLMRLRMAVEGRVVKDNRETIHRAFSTMLSGADVLITSGGTWKGERDLTVRVLEEMGWDLLFHGVRLRPGKAVAVGMLHEKPVFCLPGGPSSNEMAFLQLALPGILQMAGMRLPPFGTKRVRLASGLRGDPAWTRVYQATLERRDGEWWGDSLRLKSRMRSQARAQALIRVPEGVERVEAGEMVEVQILHRCDFILDKGLSMGYREQNGAKK
ncbi:MAG: molybdopterin molybdotransferase MoeA [Deltaproteobacteria bacterium]|nr:molybdopterin molybdotransferase MoeA [Deltaproteobacteria bacterium]MBW2048362.1 molybdopterin molybdotransferase MoeA [Deltaproteobacteria bacterium]MBW2111408.1 molybdopterin molybdotransferase MoeA [Deltaproteobacteria bacterium]